MEINYLQSKGAVITEGPSNRSYGKVVVFQDLYGNRLDLMGPIAELQIK
jgi:hypothetical protein